MHIQIRMQRTAVFSQASCQIPSPILCRRPKLHGGRLARAQVVLASTRARRVHPCRSTRDAQCLVLLGVWTRTMEFHDIVVRRALRPGPSSCIVSCHCLPFATAGCLHSQSSSILNPPTATPHPPHSVRQYTQSNAHGPLLSFPVRPLITKRHHVLIRIPLPLQDREAPRDLRSCMLHQRLYPYLGESHTSSP
jgi:hypothetical protein